MILVLDVQADVASDELRQLRILAERRRREMRRDAGARGFDVVE